MIQDLRHKWECDKLGYDPEKVLEEDNLHPKFFYNIFKTHDLNLGRTTRYTNKCVDKSSFNGNKLERVRLLASYAVYYYREDCRLDENLDLSAPDDVELDEEYCPETVIYRDKLGRRDVRDWFKEKGFSIDECVVFALQALDESPCTEAAGDEDVDQEDVWLLCSLAIYYFWCVSVVREDRELSFGAGK